MTFTQRYEESVFVLFQNKRQKQKRILKNKKPSKHKKKTPLILKQKRKIRKRSSTLKRTNKCRELNAL